MLVVVLSPLMALFSIQTLERTLKHQYKIDIENIYIGDTQPLLEGSIRLSNQVGGNIDEYIRQSRLMPLGVILNMLVTSGDDIIIYPAPAQTDAEAINPASSQEIAADNYSLMNNNLSVQIDLFIQRGSILDILIFTFFVLCGGAIFALFYFRGMLKARADANQRDYEVERLRELQNQHYERVLKLNDDKQRLAADMDAARENLTDYKIKVSKNEDSMIDEIIELEEKMRKNLELREELEAQNEELREVTEKFNARKSESKKSGADKIKKRFQALYKNVVFHKRAFDNFIDLTEDMKVKAEVVVKQLDTNSKGTDIKRKVDLRKSREKIFEAVFSYNGRLYFRNLTDKRVEIIIVGTKNSQVKDMSFLDSL